MGLFLNPCGITVHVSCIFCPVAGLSHSKAKMLWLFMSRGMQKKASFKSSTVSYLCSSFKEVGKVYGLATTGCISWTIWFVALKSWTNRYSLPLDFLTGNIGVLYSDSHSTKSPHSKKFVINPSNPS